MNIGIIGYGKMGQIRKVAVDSLPECKTIMVCDSAPVEYDVASTTDPNEIIHHNDIDAVFVCTPNFLIKDLVVQALDAGKHVFAEKPPGRTYAEVLEMEGALLRTPKQKLKFGFNHRYHDAVMEAKRRIDSGLYGRILWLRGRYGKSVDENFKSTWRADKKLAGGGILIDQGIHMLDLFLHMCGDFQDAKAFCDKQYWGLDIEDNVFAILKNDQGQTASLHSTMTQWRHLFSLEIFLTHGYMVINGILSSTRSYTNSYGKEELTISLNRSAAPVAKHTHEERYSFDVDYSFPREVEEFVNAVKNDTPIQVGHIEDAKKIMRVVEMIYKDGGER